VEPPIRVGDIEIAVTRKRIKHVRLRVHPDGHVTISAPIRTRPHFIQEFVGSRLEWIRKQQERVRGLPTESASRFVDGESHYVWGHQRVLTVVEDDDREGVELDDHRMTLFVRPGSDLASRARAMTDWHKSLLRDALPPLIEKWKQSLNVRLTGYHLRKMKSRWGSCNHRTRHIRLNTELVTKPNHLLEYVLVHELVHLIVPNHGKRFVALMDEHYPTWRGVRAELNKSSLTTA
jgi:predicted metal-dependent hydrolase